MKKRTDRKIAIAGSVAAAIVLPAVMVGLAQAGVGVPDTGKPDAASNLAPLPTFGPAQQNAPAPASSPTGTPTIKPPAKPLTSNPFSTGPGTPSSNNPDLNTHKRGKKAHLPEKEAELPTKFKMADDGAKITALKKVSKNVFDVTIASPALGTSVQTRVLIPAGWKLDSKTTYPVVYAFHGGNNNYQSWTKDSNLLSVAAGYNAMVVMPEGGWNGSYANWWNDGKGGIPMWETFHINEVIPLMERNFHAGSARAAIGLSSGGQGAVTYAQRHPGLFRYIASYSGALNITAPGMPAMLMQMNQKAGDDIWGDPVRDRANWQAHDATVMAAKLKGVGVYVSCGNGEIGPYDNPGMKPWDAGRFGEQLAHTMNVNFVDAARKAGVNVTANMYGAGTHKWAYWKRELTASWPAITGAIGAKKS